jgi:translation initiation factor 2B subunit (eIF-2B alpha/beta/delta family)
MKLEELKSYKINEQTVLSNNDRKHIENYKQLILFFENAITNSMSNEGVKYSSLHGSCMQCIRFLDSLISTYDSNLESVRFLNNKIDEIIKNNKPLAKQKIDDEKKE